MVPKVDESGYGIHQLYQLCNGMPLCREGNKMPSLCMRLHRPASKWLQAPQFRGSNRVVFPWGAFAQACWCWVWRLVWDQLKDGDTVIYLCLYFCWAFSCFKQEKRHLKYVNRYGLGFSIYIYTYIYWTVLNYLLLFLVYVMWRVKLVSVLLSDTFVKLYRLYSIDLPP